jgi:hypothetical protein
MKFVDDEAWEASRTLAEERGVMPTTRARGTRPAGIGYATRPSPP